MFILNIILLFLSSTVQAKYSMKVFTIPCEKIELKIITCKSYKFSNISKLRDHQKENKNIHFYYSGALVTAEVLNQNPIKCYKKQKMNLKLYKKRKLKNKFFVKDLTCDQSKSIIKVSKPNMFCDTPGAASIRDCFLRSYSRENKFEYTLFNLGEGV